MDWPRILSWICPKKNISWMTLFCPGGTIGLTRTYTGQENRGEQMDPKFTCKSSATSINLMSLLSTSTPTDTTKNLTSF